MDDRASSVTSYSPTPPPYNVSEDEAKFYYAGISRSPPRLIYRTDLSARPWVKPKGLEAYRQLKRVDGVFNHKLVEVWDEVGPKVVELLEGEQVAWTSVDVCRFVTYLDNGDEDKVGAPVVIWVGVHPISGANQAEQIFKSAGDILKLLSSSGVQGVTVEYRESAYKRLDGPPLLSSVSRVNPTVDVRGPLTAALGLSICASDRSEAQGTMALYLAEGAPSGAVLGLTCHHVLFKTDTTSNESYLLRGAGARRNNVQLLGTRAFDKLLEAIQLRIGRHGIMIRQHEDWIEKLVERVGEDEEIGEGDDEELVELKTELAVTREDFKKVEKTIEGLEKFYADVRKDWGQPKQRVIGHIRFSPELAFDVGTEGFTEDWGVFEIDKEKFRKAFRGNVIDLDTKMTPDEFTLKMYPRQDGRTTFKYPSDRLLPLRDIIPKERLRSPDMLDHDNEPCLIVIKSGNATGVTIGRATGLFSFVRDEDTGESSKEWAMYNYDKNSNVFSARGDSGSIVVDGMGRIGGMITGAAGKTETSDVTYATPMYWLSERIKETYPNAHLNPTIAADA